MDERDKKLVIDKRGLGDRDLSCDENGKMCIRAGRFKVWGCAKVELISGPIQKPIAVKSRVVS